jgi:hypothetical protein
VQSRVVVIANDPCPPGAGKVAGLLVTVRSHRSDTAAGAVMDVSVLLQVLDANTAHAAAKTAA